MARRRSDSKSSAELKARSAKISEFAAQWELGRLPSEPAIAFLDLENKTLKELGPGMLTSVSFDGKHLLFMRVELDGADIARFHIGLIDSDGKNRHPIGVESTAFAAFSPDAKQTCHALTAAGHSEIFITDGDGKNPRRITTVPTLYSSPRWTADGKSIEFTRIGRGRTGIPTADELKDNGVWLMNVDGSNLRRESPAGHACCVDRDWDTLILQPTLAQMNDPKAAPRLPGEKPAARVKVISNVEFEGSKIFTRDAAGHRTPVPDGDYNYRGLIIHVKNGERLQEAE